MNWKVLLSNIMLPAARCGRLIETATRLWSFTRLRVLVKSPLDPSNVICGVPEVHGTRNIQFGKNLFFYPGVYLETNGDGVIVVEDGVVLSRGVHIVSHSKVLIGQGAMIGEYSSIRDANHRRSTQGMRTSGFDSEPIEVQNNVWIGRGAAILKGVTIGRDSIIGANAVVTRDVRSGSIVGGVPAVELRKALAL